MKPFGALSAAALRTLQPAGLIHAGGAADHLAVLQAAGQGSSVTNFGQGGQQQSRQRQATQRPTTLQTRPQTRIDTLQPAGQSAAPQHRAGLSVEGVLEHWANALFKARCNLLKNAGGKDYEELEWLKSSRAEIKGKQKGELTSFSEAVRDDIKRMAKKKPSSKNAGMSVQEVVTAFRANGLTRDDKYCFGLWCLLALQQDELRSDETQRRLVVTLLEKVHQSLIGDGDKFGCSPARKKLLGDFASAANHTYDPSRLEPTANWTVEQKKRMAEVTAEDETCQFIIENETCQFIIEKSRRVIWVYNQASSCYELFGQFFEQQGIEKLVFMSEHLRGMRDHFKTVVEQFIESVNREPELARLAGKITEEFKKSGKLDEALRRDVLERVFIDQMANVHASMEYTGELEALMASNQDRKDCLGALRNQAPATTESLTIKGLTTTSPAAAFSQRSVA